MKLRCYLVLIISLFTQGAFADALSNSHPMVHNLAKAVAFPTVSHQDKSRFDARVFKDFLAFLESTYPQTFAHLDRTFISEYSVVLRWQGQQESLAPVLFDAHYDVVPVEVVTLSDWQPTPLSGWKYPPFEGRIEDGYIWGRGTLDDKSAVIAYFEAIESMLLKGFKPDRTLYFAFVHDEEIGGKKGALKVAEYLLQQNIRFAYVVVEGGIVLDEYPLLPEEKVAMIALAEKTYISLKLIARANGGHSSIPLADNSIVQLANAVKQLHERPLPARLVSPIKDMLKTLSPYIGGIKGLLMQYPSLTEPLILSFMAKEPSTNALIRSTTAVTMLNAGIKENVIPKQAVAIVNFRLLPGDTVEELVNKVKIIIDNDDIEIVYEASTKASRIADVHGVGYQVIQQSIAAIFDEAIVTPSMMTATTDARHYQKLSDNVYHFRSYNIPIQDIGSIHNINERLSVEAAIKMFEFSKTLIKVAAQ